MKHLFRILTVSTLLFIGTVAGAQKYNKTVDKTVAIVGGELITLSDVEAEAQAMIAQGYVSDRSARCELLERLMEAKLFLMQARVDSLTINKDMVESELSNHIDRIRTALGGDEQVEEYFHKPLYKLRQEWRSKFEEQSLTQQEQQNIAKEIPELTPYDVKVYLDTVNKASLPVIPTKYKMSQICFYPDRDSAAIATKETLLSLRERIIKGERFATLARLYSEDPASARKGGELGMASKSIFWPVFSDAAMSLKPGTISQIVETPDGYHIIEVIEKKGDMFNARHILIKPKYTAKDREKAFEKLDSLRKDILDSTITFELAAHFFSQDPASRTNGGQMSDPTTGSAYFEIDQMKPQDYKAIMNLKEGEISEPIESLDNEGRDGNIVYKIVRLDKIVPSHEATFTNDYTALLDDVRSVKQVEAINKFMDEKIKTTYIRIDPLFGDCDFSRKGWSSKIGK